MLTTGGEIKDNMVDGSGGRRMVVMGRGTKGQMLMVVVGRGTKGQILGRERGIVDGTGGKRNKESNVDDW